MCAKLCKAHRRFAGRGREASLPPPFSGQNVGGSALRSSASPSSGALSLHSPYEVLPVLGVRVLPQICFLNDSSQEESSGVRVLIPVPILVLTLHIVHISKGEACSRQLAHVGSILRLPNPPED